MQTVDKAIALLGFFSPAEPEVGLSELARIAGYDKAATRRFLVALGKHGFIEQNPVNRRYRLGSAFLKFARIREATVPLASVIQPVLEAMATATGETSHASLLTGDSLATICVAEPQRGTRVYVDPSEPLPLHATASGLACLAHAGASFHDSYFVRQTLERHTDHTVLSRSGIEDLLAAARRDGYARAERSFTDDVIGTAAAFFDASGRPAGAIAIAAIASRFTPDAARLIAAEVVAAAAAVTSATGGREQGS